MVGSRRRRPDATAHGELHFGWVLGGRAVQDIWIVPGRASRARGAAAGVPRLDDPLLRRGDRRLALDLDRPGERPRPALHRAAGDGDILLVSDEDEPQLRWRFTEIEVRSFVWRGEISHDRGATWTLDEEMRITRR